ncbi:AAA family ATPase [Bacteroides gallinaceum]|uniref:McrB family protein n=1 Tax=Bacteroides gallinaceum TaxID=1462571 RepID=UPI0025A38FA3|nr:AAA family ATPase [Bacteroides gallinaceum]MDM8155561.1 AAA family ATPase [Bacteroides gallinaceum]
MERTDFIENRADVIKNIYTLYSYLRSNSEEERDWALNRFKQGKWYIVEPFGNMLFFAPSRFVGYKNNNIAKHTENHGDGTQTNEYFRRNRLYKISEDEFLSKQFKNFMLSIGIDKESAQFFIPYNQEISDLQSGHKCYFICPTHCSGQKEDAWKSFFKKGIMAIGWNNTDYSNYTLEEITKEYVDDAKAITAFTLIKQIKEGDIICCTNNAYGLWGIGIATSSYRFKENIHKAGVDDDGEEAYYSHYINVAWICFKEQGFIPTSDLHIHAPEKMWQPYGTLTQKDIPQYITDYILKANHTNMETTNRCNEYIALLKVNKNLILTGAPGTGKTYLAREIVTAMGAEYGFVQFHPSYDYTDFVEGLRPTPPDSRGNIGFERKNGVFKEFCKRAIEENINGSTDIDSNDELPVMPSEQIILKKHGKSFDEVYDILVNDIKKDQAVLYSDFRNNRTKLNVKIRPGERIQGKEVIEFWKTNDYQKAQIDYIKRIYDFYISKGQFDIRNERFNDFTNIIGNTLDYSYYRGIVQGLLDRTRQVKNDNYIDTLKTEHFNHPDVLPLTQTVQPQPIASSQPTNDTKEASKPFVFIIDEINRGEISKIFGELFFSIDPGYRGKSGRVKTQYQNMIDEKDPFYEGFYVPENVYIIGTMNDIDRSVESMDFAMRRRFAWKEIKANENTGMLDSFGGLKNEIISKMNRLNNAIWNEETNEGIEGLSAAYHIGGAYFKKLELYDYENNQPEAYRQLWENHLRGVLFEYLRGSFNAADNLKKLEEVYYSKGIYE